MSQEPKLSRNRTQSHFCASERKPADRKRLSVKETRTKNFRDTLRKLLRSNENVFGKADTREEALRLMQEHADKETDDYGRRVMQ